MESDKWTIIIVKAQSRDKPLNEEDYHPTMGLVFQTPFLQSTSAEKGCSWELPWWVQWLGLHTLPIQGPGSIPGQELSRATAETPHS